MRTLYIKLSFIRTGSYSWLIWSLEKNCCVFYKMTVISSFYSASIIFTGPKFFEKPLIFIDTTSGKVQIQILFWKAIKFSIYLYSLYSLVYVTTNCVYKARTRRNFELSFHFCTIDFDARISDSVYLRATKRESLNTKMQ